jgi:hypothetical protein
MDIRRIATTRLALNTLHVGLIAASVAVLLRDVPVTWDIFQGFFLIEAVRWTRWAYKNGLLTKTPGQIFAGARVRPLTAGPLERAASLSMVAAIAVHHFHLFQ